MFIQVTNNNGKKYLILAKSIRVENKNGVKTARRKTVLNIGPLSKYDDGKPNYLERLRQSFKDGEPLIPELQPYCDGQEKETEKYVVTFEKENECCFADPKWCANIIFDRIFDEIGLTAFFSEVKCTGKIEYDLLGLIKLMVYGRILEPQSKFSTFMHNNKYYKPICKSENPFNVYDMLDVVYENFYKIQTRINNNLTKRIGRNPSVIFYDVTNFFFETENPDDDIIDENGDIIEKGLRKNGVSKENRKSPIVQMGLFLDDEGIPVSMEMFPGNTLDAHTLRPALKNTMNKLGFEKYILIADRGICNGPNCIHILDENNGYIISKSIKKTNKQEREWILNEDGYNYISENFKYKSRIVRRTVKDENGKLREFDEKVIVYWSKKFYDKEVYENARFLKFLEEMQEHPGSFRVTKTLSRQLNKLIKTDVVNVETGEVLDSKKLKAMLDEDKIKEMTAYYGYYQIVTSETDMNDIEIIDKYHGLTRIEDQFREMKGTLETRPIYVSNSEHIKAHLLLCFISLIMLRLIQRKVSQSSDTTVDAKKNWTYGISGERIQQALRDFQIDKLPNDYYRFSGLSNADLQAVLKSYGIQISKKLYRRGDILEIKGKINVF